MGEQLESIVGREKQPESMVRQLVNVTLVLAGLVIVGSGLYAIDVWRGNKVEDYINSKSRGEVVELCQSFEYVQIPKCAPYLNGKK